MIPIFPGNDPARRERIGGALADAGQWRDLGTREEYLRAHRELHAEKTDEGAFPRYGAPDPNWRNWVHPTARIAADASLRGACVAGENARVGEGAALEDSILWANAEIASRAGLKDCIVRSFQTANGTAAGHVF